MEKLRFGANYIPAKNWLFNWMDWDASAVEEDLIASKEIGIDHIRANLLWPYFQLDQYVLSPSAMKHFEEFCEICEKVGMDYCLAVFTGFMSGKFFYPAWIKKFSGAFECGMFNNPEIMKAEEFFLRQIADVVKDKPRFIGFDLGNELSCIVNGDPKVTRQQCDEWNTRMLALCEELVPGKLHNNGVDHQPWFNDKAFSRRVLANTGAITPLHCYSYFTGGLNFGRMSAESVHLAPFMVEAAKAYTNDPDRKFWIQEFGTVDEVFDEEMSRFITESMHAMYTSPNLWGITWWCTHNLDERFTSYDALEFKLGLFDTNNRLTPSGELYKKLIAEYKSGNFAPVQRTKALVFNQYDEQGVINSRATWKNGNRYAELVNQGIYPAFILPEKVNDKEYLKSRGITEIIE